MSVLGELPVEVQYADQQPKELTLLVVEGAGPCMPSWEELACTHTPGLEDDWGCEHAVQVSGMPQSPSELTQ